MINPLKDMWVFLKSLKFFKYLRRSNPLDQEIYDILSRGCPPQPKLSFLFSLYQTLVPRIHLREHTALQLPSNCNFARSDDNYEIYYINGVNVTKRACITHTYMLSQALRHNVTALYNPTNGIVIDLLESILGRTFNIREPVTRSFEKIIRERLLNTNKRIVLIGHSQGAIIISNLIKRLKENKKAAYCLPRLEVYTFGSAADEMEILPYAPVHFANTYDMVAQLGVIKNINRTYGLIIERPRYGHSFVRNYLPGFVDGEYGKDNNLYQQFRKKKYNSYN